MARYLQKKATVDLSHNRKRYNFWIGVRDTVGRLSERGDTGVVDAGSVVEAAKIVARKFPGRRGVLILNDDDCSESLTVNLVDIAAW